MSVLTDAGSKLPADFAGAAAVRVTPLAEAGEVTLDVVGLYVAELLLLITVDGYARPDVVPVVMVNVQTNVFGDLGVCRHFEINW